MTEYSDAVDPIVYDDAVTLDEEDWAMLGIAAFDQAGLTQGALQNVLRAIQYEFGDVVHAFESRGAAGAKEG